VFSPNENRIATAGSDGTATLFDTEEGVRLGALAHGGAITAMHFGADGKRLLTASRDGTAKLWDADSALRIATVDHGGAVIAAGFRGVDTVVTANDAGSIKAWSADSGEPAQDLAQLDGQLAVAAFSPAGDAIATAGDGSRTVTVTRLGDSPRTVALAGHRDAVAGAAFSADGARIVTASLDSTARIWNANTGALLATLTGHTGAVSYASFDAPGARVVTASDDGSAKIWDAASGALLTSLEGHERPVKYAAFDPDGSRVVTASDDGAAILWDTRVDERSRRDIRKLIERHVPWRVEGSTLVPAR